MPSRTAGIRFCCTTCLIWVGVWSCSVLSPGMGYAQPADDEVEVQVEASAPVPRLDAQRKVNTYSLVSSSQTATGAWGILNSRLKEKLQVVELICGTLSADQKKMLQLAGAGDVKRIMTSLDELDLKSQEISADDAIRLLEPDLDRLRRLILSDFLEDSSSLFSRTRSKVLNERQTARLTMVRTIERLGGRVVPELTSANPSLEISLAGIPFDDLALARLTTLPHVVELNLSGTQVTSGGMLHLAGFRELQVLDLTSTRVTDAALKDIGAFRALRRLELFNTRVTGTGFVHLQHLKELRTLNLSDTPVTDAGLGSLRELKRLETLNLRQTSITDEGLGFLAELSHLEWLDLSHTGVTDAGLIHLHTLPALVWINLSETAVSDDGLARLKQAKPKANIWKRPRREPD
ncbi:MAG: hypothetical protein JSS02_01635 [Planctomycetes bacterium]|nr:hypothetical protein [Planctomycetota bacterium]